MATPPPLRLLGGLASSPMEAGANDCVDAVNVHPSGGRLICRRGMRALRAVGSTTTNLYTGWGTASVEPTTVSTGSISPSASNVHHLYFGLSSKFYRFDIYGTVHDLSTVLGGSNTYFFNAYRNQRQLTFQYWNGSAWTTLDCADRFQPFLDTSNSTYGTAPYFSRLNTGALTDSDCTGFHLRGLVQPPTDWATKTINGQTLYWLRVEIEPEYIGDPDLTYDSVGTSSVATTGENRIKHVSYFRDRNGARHEFLAYQYGSTGVEMRYEIDGSNLTVGDSLQPDGTAKVFNDRQVVTAYYHQSTDRVIGCVEDWNWFYAIPGEGAIYRLDPDYTGTDTPYAGIVGGLRSALPTGRVTAMHDDRLWVFRGDTAYYSAPGVYADIWPNDFEIALGDDGGEVTGAASLAGVLAVFKRDSIWIVQASGESDGYIAYKVPGNVGCIASRGVAVMGNTAYFPAEDGIYSFNGESVQKLSGKVEEYYQDNIARADASAMIGVVSSNEDQYRLFHAGIGSVVADSALYASFEGEGPSFWPQGKYSAGDYGFQATAITVDSTEARERIVLGDRYGCLWEMDFGYTDGPSAVKCKITSARVNLGTASQVMLEFVTPTQPFERSADWTLNAWANGNEASKQSLTFDSGGDNPAGASFTTAGTYTTSGTFSAMMDEQALQAGGVQVLGRFVQVQALKTFEGPWTLDAVELEFQPWGRRV